jgi:hypothetical protein
MESVMEPNVQPKKLSMSAKIREYMRTNPNDKPEKVAEALGAKIASVYSVKKYDKDRAARLKAKKKVAVSKHLPVYDKITEMLQRPDTLHTLKPVAKPVVDMVNHPPHNTLGGIETIDFIAAKLTKEEFLGYLKGNVLKYGSRIGNKGAAILDAGKLSWYAKKLQSVLSSSS